MVGADPGLDKLVCHSCRDIQPAFRKDQLGCKLRFALIKLRQVKLTGSAYFLVGKIKGSDDKFAPGIA
jgi:hypothetical protein